MRYDSALLKRIRPVQVSHVDQRELKTEPLHIAPAIRIQE